MDNPGLSLFQHGDINLNNSQNNEEEEDLEEQRRRNEELQNLLMEKLDDFNFDESTIQSSTNVSVVSLEDVQKNYRNAIDPNEQLKVLYEVRIRELNSLKMEYDDYKIEKSKEIDKIKNKLFVNEAEIQQLKLSYKNSEELLMEKESEIKELTKELKSKEEHIKNNEKLIENFQIDINTYQTAISELQLKLQAGPIYNSKQFNSEELQKAHQEQIIRLENLLEQQTKSSQLLEKEKNILEEQLQKRIATEKEDQNIIDVLTKNFESAQKQCEELIKVIEELSTENRHIKDRLNTSIHEKNDDSVDPKLADHVEKLKKMLVDKSIEINVLKSKNKNYEDNAKELLEYRKLKSDVYRKEFQQCDNKEHTKSLLVMQNDLQNYRRIIDDKNQQILTLNSNNKDLLEKMEDMLSQTRNDIQNFSHKYNLPQLDKMAQDLETAEKKIKILESSLEDYQKKRQSLSKVFKKASANPEYDIREECESILTQLVVKYELEIKKLENQIEKLNLYVEQLVKENSKLKGIIENNDMSELKKQYAEALQQLDEARNKIKILKDNIPTTDENQIKKLQLHIDYLTHENIKLKDSIKNNEESEFMKPEALKQLDEAKNKIKNLEDNLQKMNDINQIAEQGKIFYQSQLKDCETEMEKLCQTLKTLEVEVSQLSKTIQEKDELINKLMEKSCNNESLRKEIDYKENALKMLENNKKELIELLEKTNNELEESKKVVLTLQQQLLVASERNVRRNLETELKEAEVVLSQSKTEKDMEAVEFLKSELNIREEIQKEYLQKLKEIEGNYQKAYLASKASYKELADKLRVQENRYREQLAVVLKECAQKIKSLEEDRNKLLEEIRIIHHNFEQYQAKVGVSEEAYKKVVKNINISAQKNVDEWKRWSKTFVSNCLKIETVNKNFRENLYYKLNHYDKEVSAIEKSHDDKIRKYVKNCR